MRSILGVGKIARAIIPQSWDELCEMFPHFEVAKLWGLEKIPRSAMVGKPSSMFSGFLREAR